MAQWLLYGANGYTGDLIAREAVKRGHRPILAGRNRAAVEALAKELDCEARVFDLDAIDIKGADLVLHCAGPFSRTSAPMVQACLDAGAHYLDITGEIAVFEAVMARDADARKRGVTLLPGVGFDVVPTDCLALMLKDRMPDAKELWLAIHWQQATLSPGTLKTMIDGAGDGSAIRRDGVIVRVPPAYDVRDIPFEPAVRKAMTIAWGDVSTAFYTTGIPNIRVYAAASPKAISRARRTRLLAPLLKLGVVKGFLQKIAGKRKGPTEEQRAKGQIHLWGRVANAKGDELTMTLTVAEGYTFTVKSAIAALERVLAEPVQPGATTPAKRFGAGFVNAVG
jgi:short subunit dehydrogenase-like uncharacterized protein